MFIYYMDELFESFSWDDIYRYWEQATSDELKIVNQPLPCCRVKPVNNIGNRIYCYFWLKNTEIYNAVSRFNREISMPIYQQYNEMSDKRVQRSADLMMQAKCAEERAAIWIFVFCSALENNCEGLLVDYVGANARMYLQNHFQEWVFLYHHRLPYMYFDPKKLQNLKYKHYKAVIDCAIANAYIISREYTITLFDSELRNEDLPDSYKNLRKK